jgi:phage baseplate assembly protein gpV
MRGGGPSPWAGDHVLAGVYYAIVCQNKDDEKKLGRIKVRFPWLDGGDKDQAHWAQVATPMSGNKFGWYNLPEIDDMVAVVFIGGDIRQPIVLGGVWSKTDKPPEPVQDGKNEFRGMKSRSGHRLLLDDSDKPKVTIRDKNNKLVVTIGEFQKGGAGPNATCTAVAQGAGTNGIAVASMEGKLNILCPDGTLTIEAINVEISADQKLDIKAQGDLKLKGATIDIVSAGAGKYEGSTTDLN